MVLLQNAIHRYTKQSPQRDQATFNALLAVNIQGCDSRHFLPSGDSCR